MYSVLSFLSPTHFFISFLVAYYILLKKSMHCGIFGYPAMWKTLENCRTDHYHGSKAFYLGVYVLLIWSVSEARSWPVCGSEADVTKQMLGRCQGWNVLGGIHFLFNRLLRTCLLAVAYGSGKLMCIGRVCVYFWIVFKNDYSPKKANYTLSPSMYVFAIKALHFSLGFDVG